MEHLAKTFEDLVRRMLGPATSFFVFLFLIHAIESLIEGSVDHCWIMMWFHKTNLDPMASINMSNPTQIIIMGAIALVGMSYILASLHALIFDSRLRGSFAGNDKDFIKLRNRAIEKLNSISRLSNFGLPLDEKDYYLYEIIGGIDQAPTNSFVDSAKTYGIVFLSFTLALMTIVVCLNNWCYILFFIIAIVFLIWLGNTQVMAQYRWRAVRLYVNLIMMPEEKIEGILADYKRQNQKESQKE